MGSRSFRYAETGVWQSSMNVWCSGIRLWWRASSRTRASDGAGPVTCASALATAIQHPLGVGQAQVAPAQQHGQVVEHVGRFLGDALV